MPENALDYLKIFKRIEADVEAHPLLELVRADYQAGLPKETLEGHLAALGNPALESIAPLYQEVNGLEIAWRFSSSLEPDRFRHFQARFDDYAIPDHGQEHPVGSVELLPFEEVFINCPSYFDTSEADDFETRFNGRSYRGNTFGRLLRPFDLFSEYACMAFVLEPEATEVKVMLLSDYYIVWDHSRVTNLREYINFLAVSRGLISCRDVVFSEYRGDEMPPLTFDPRFSSEIEPRIFKERHSGQPSLFSL